MRISDWSSDVCSSDLRRGKEAGRGTNESHNAKRRGASLKHGRKAAYHKHAGRHHRRSMDESGYRRRSLHCVRKPSVKTNLRRLAHGTDEQQQAEDRHRIPRSEEHTSELQSLMRISYADFCLKKKT